MIIYIGIFTYFIHLRSKYSFQRDKMPALAAERKRWNPKAPPRIKTPKTDNDKDNDYHEALTNIFDPNPSNNLYDCCMCDINLDDTLLKKEKNDTTKYQHNTSTHFDAANG